MRDLQSIHGFQLQSSGHQGSDHPGPTAKAVTIRPQTNPHQLRDQLHFSRSLDESPDEEIEASLGADTMEMCTSRHHTGRGKELVVLHNASSSLDDDASTPIDPQNTTELQPEQSSFAESVPDERLADDDECIDPATMQKTLSKFVLSIGPCRLKQVIPLPRVVDWTRWTTRLAGTPDCERVLIPFVQDQHWRLLEMSCADQLYRLYDPLNTTDRGSTYAIGEAFVKSVFPDEEGDWDADYSAEVRQGGNIRGFADASRSRVPMMLPRLVSASFRLRSTSSLV